MYRHPIRHRVKKFPSGGAIIFALLLFQLLFCAGDSMAQCNEWEKLLEYEEVFVYDLERDRLGNLYVIGSFSSPNFVVDGVLLPLHGLYSMFILKFDKDFSLQWAKSIGNDVSDYALAIELDHDDNPVITGYFYSALIDFDCIRLHRTSRSELFLVKYNPAGNVLWALGTAGLNDGTVANVAITASNNIILTSSFVTGNVSFGGKEVQGAGGYDSFVASVTPAGSVTWMKSFGGEEGSFEPDYIYGLAVDDDENIFMTGFFESDVMLLDGFIIPRKTVSENLFVAKLSESGEVIWAHGTEGPSDVGGYDIDVDHDGNVYVVGRFFNESTTFENVTLASEGEADIFIVKYDSDGNVLLARNFGGTGFDAAQEFDFDAAGNLVITGYFYSYDLPFDSYTLSKPAFESDVFVITVDDALAIQCVKHVSGSAETLAVALSVDPADNTWLVVDNAFGGESNFNGIFISAEISSVAVIGNNNDFDPADPTHSLFDIDLGQDIIKCVAEEITMDAGQYCQAVYTWSDGSHEHSLTTGAPGEFWVMVDVNGSVARDTIIIEDRSPYDIDLGADREICDGDNTSFDVTQPGNPQYKWDDGSDQPVRTVYDPGMYWVEVTGEVCEPSADSILVLAKPPLVLDLGKDTVLCSTSSFQLGKEIPGGQSYRWQDNSTSPTLSVSASGNYELAVSNECEEVKDDITITFFNIDEYIIPNVVTVDGNLKNDVFILPSMVTESASLTIFNRWGSKIFSTRQYQNNWPGNDESTGVYFYILKGSCLPRDLKGYIHLLR